MRKIILYIAASMDGYIADIKGGVEWLESIPNPDKLDYGYQDFYDSIGTTLMGYGTFEQLLNWDIPFPYIGKSNFVVTRKASPEPHDHVQFITMDHIEKIRDLKRKAEKDIWLIGGSQLNSFLLNNNLIDHIQLYTMPIILNDGIKIFSGPDEIKQFSLSDSKTYKNGVVMSNYNLRLLT